MVAGQVMSPVGRFAWIVALQRRRFHRIRPPVTHMEPSVALPLQINAQLASAGKFRDLVPTLSTHFSANERTLLHDSCSVRNQIRVPPRNITHSLLRMVGDGCEQ
jgi:hypothetical protein